MKLNRKKQTKPKIPDESRKSKLVSVMVEPDMKAYLDELAEAHSLPLSTFVRNVFWEVVPDMVRKARGEG